MFFHEHYCVNPNEFIDAISLRGSTFTAQGKYYWLFRGQPEVSPLIPSAWRASVLCNLLPERKIKTYEDLVRSEFEIARRFFLLADARGLRLPEDTQSLRDYMYGRREFQAEEWPPPPLRSLLAIVQHYGLPTRLLDWTWNPYVAAYFAASGAYRKLKAKNLKKTDLFEVYALSRAVCDADQLGRQLGIEWSGDRVELVTAPTAGNDNLRAQEGAFTLCVPKLTDTHDPIPNTSIDGLINAFQKGNVAYILLHRFTLPAEHAWLLLYLLGNEGVSASSVEPGYAGVAREVEELMREGVGSL